MLARLSQPARRGVRRTALQAFRLLAVLRLGFCWLAAALACSAAGAHEFTLAELELQENAAGSFSWQWAPGSARPEASEVQLSWPAGCATQPGLARCTNGLKGNFGLKGLGQRYAGAVLKVQWLDGQVSVHTLTAAQPDVQLLGSADDRRGAGEITWSYLVLGVNHILAGIDHLLFVLGLLFLVGFGRRLVWTISAFTVAHSLTLGLSAMGWLTLRSPPVEAVIALSIVLVAAEALQRRDTLTRRWPALVAFVFGLLHGLGFAGALKAVGLPEAHLPLALLGFNLGVEAGQLLAVAAAWVVWRAMISLPHLARWRTLALYGMGSVAAYWAWLRVAVIVNI